MKYLFFNRKTLLFSTLLATTLGLNAQIKSTHTDEKYAYTTVVYKDKAATDKDVLAALDNSIGMGDVVRVTVAPPKPAAIPTIDKAKGEDVWLKPTAKPVTLVAGASTMPPVPAAPAAAPAPVVKAAPLAPNPVVKKVAVTPNVVVAPVQNQTTETKAAAPVTVRTKSVTVAKSGKSAHKSFKKAGKKGNGGFKMKGRKKGKQRYSCPTF